MKTKICIIIFALLFVTCNSKTRQQETPQENKIQYEPITIDELEKLITSDLNRSKIIVFYDPSCDACDDYIRTVYKTLMRKVADSVNIYLISKTYSPEKIEYLFRKHSIILPAYYNSDPKIEYSHENFPVIIRRIFPNVEDIVLPGMPFSLIVDKQNRLITKRYRESNGVINTYPVDLFDLKDISPKLINSLPLDTLVN